MVNTTNTQWTSERLLGLHPPGNRHSDGRRASIAGGASAQAQSGIEAASSVKVLRVIEDFV